MRHVLWSVVSPAQCESCSIKMINGWTRATASWTFSRQPLSCCSVTGNILTNQVFFHFPARLESCLLKSAKSSKFLLSSIKALPPSVKHRTFGRGLEEGGDFPGFLDVHVGRVCHHGNHCFVSRSQERLGEAASGRVCVSGEGGSRVEKLSSRRQHLCLRQQVCESLHLKFGDFFFCIQYIYPPHWRTNFTQYAIIRSSLHF